MSDPPDFEAFVRARSTALLRTAYLLTGDRGLAEDLLQTTLGNCYRQWKRLGGKAGAEAYVRTTLLNTYISGQRRRRVRECLRDQLPEAPTQDEFLTVDDRHELRTALGLLGPRARAAVVLRYYEDLPEAEVAEIMGCSIGTVKSLTSRGLSKLRSNLPSPTLVMQELASNPSTLSNHG